MIENRSSLQERLDVIEGHLVTMMEMVASQAAEVTTALLEGDVSKADDIIAADDEMDLISLQVEEGCTDTLVLEQPVVAADLRFVIAALHINSDIERSGDLCANIAKAVGRIQGSHPDDHLRDFVARMSAQAVELFHRAAVAFKNRDDELAKSIDELDDILDDLHRSYIQHVISSGRRGDLDAQQALQFALIGRFYERIGDHAENIGDRVRYIIDGWSPERAAAERAQARKDGTLEFKPSAGIAMIEQVAEERRVDAIRRDFVANVSHELKTPIGAISLLADTLADETNAGDRERLTEMLLGETRRVESIIDDLLELSRLDEADGREKVVDVDDIVNRSLDKASAFAASSGVEVAVVGLPSHLQIVGDRRELVRALTNLIDNAVRYSETESRVTVTVEDLGSDLSISVADEGLGIPRAELERVFERFYRVDRARSRDTGGTGLGLAIVRHAVTNHGGTVEVKSTPGEGSVFTMTIPAHREG